MTASSSQKHATNVGRHAHALDETLRVVDNYDMSSEKAVIEEGRGNGTSAAEEEMRHAVKEKCDVLQEGVRELISSLYCLSGDALDLDDVAQGIFAKLNLPETTTHEVYARALLEHIPLALRLALENLLPPQEHVDVGTRGGDNDVLRHPWRADSNPPPDDLAIAESANDSTAFSIPPIEGFSDSVTAEDIAKSADAMEYIEPTDEGDLQHALEDLVRAILDWRGKFQSSLPASFSVVGCDAVAESNAFRELVLRVVREIEHE